MVRARAIVATSLAVLGLALVGSVSAGGGHSPPASSSVDTLYNAGDRVDGLPLAAILRRADTAEFVSFIYGDCVSVDDAGCAPPAEIQIWPACRRNLGLYDDAIDRGALAERISLRGVPALLFDDGTRLELETGRSTVVVFAGTRVRVLRIAAALRALDETDAPGLPLPKPVRVQGGEAMGC